MTAPRLRRSGVTLLEVLVAIFVMAIGLLALLTLFPLGAMQMAQAIKDDRCAQQATQADALLRSHHYNAYLPATGPMAYKAPLIVGENTNGEAFTDPQAGFMVGNAQRIYPDYPAAGYYPTPSTPVNPAEPPPFPPGSPSYPVMLDGLGYFARLSSEPERSWVARRSPATVANIPPPRYLMPRRSALGFTSPSPTSMLIQAFALTDDLTFEKNGRAAASPTLERQGRYNWAAIVQLPRFETASVMRLTVMVYDGRPPLLASAGDEMMLTVQPTLTVGSRAVTVVVPPRDEGSAPLIRRGGWILDSTIAPVQIRSTVVNPATDYRWVRNANFYRISGVTDDGPVPGGNQFTLDLETPIKPLWDGRATYTDAAAPLSYPANVTLFAGLAEVFERSDLRPHSSN